MLKGKTGVYCLSNKRNGKRYVGSAARCLAGRIQQHRRDLRSGRHKNRHLQASWDKYGETSFIFCVLEICLPEICIDREQYWIDKYRSYDRSLGYNLVPVAGSVLGLRHSDQTKKLLSKKSREHWEQLSDEQKALYGKGMLGKKLPPEIVAKIAESNRGRKDSEAVKLKKKAAQQQRGSWQSSEEYREKLRQAWKARKERGPSEKERLGWQKTAAANLGQKRDKESRARMSLSQKGRLKSEECKRKISAKLAGRKLSIDHRAAISAGVRRFQSCNSGVEV